MKNEKDLKNSNSEEVENKNPQTEKSEDDIKLEEKAEDTTMQRIRELKDNLEKKEKEAKENYERLQRIAAEFDNYKKRTSREKESLYKDAVLAVMTNMLPIIDNFERAFESCHEDTEKVIEGIKMIEKQFKDVMKTYEVTEIDAVNNKFDPKLHEAVIHIEDESYGENTVIEELRKGYKCGDRVLRHSMVKVAN